ncbi:carnosic acid synthase-like [Salvia hispanica]|uniref:carnosic acid synthase-like n=1 Tax=Salvia hispanica TaxID=49212 RepID=UPI0020091830|nr:carnosic acid synthase-like [Salvia hispanica]
MQVNNILAWLGLAMAAAWVVHTRWLDPWRHRRGLRFPPGPPCLPILGNVLQLGRNPHKSLAELAKRYGPLMSLKLGTQFVGVVSSPEMAREILQRQGLVFSMPFSAEAVCVLGHERMSMGLLSTASAQWRKLRRISKEHLFSPAALQASQHLRQERLRKLAAHVSERCGAPMNVGEATFATMSNLMFGTLFAIEIGNRRDLREHVNSLTRLAGAPNLADFFPLLAPFDPQGLRRNLTYHLRTLMALIQTLIDQRLQARTASDYHRTNDSLETLLDIVQGNEYDLSIEEIKHMFVDLIIAGSDTSAATAEWAMVELLLHPDKLAKLKAELNNLLGDQTCILQESDISKLPYLQATVKEVLRYHPAAPLLAPHVAKDETKINGYVIPKHAKIFINAWAISRDPAIWNNPDRFEPERFLDNDIDFGGHHFNLIPFGSGRKICPGMPLASRMLHCMIATLCHNFDWKLQQGTESKQFQREDVFGLVLQKKNPLWAIPINKV